MGQEITDSEFDDAAFAEFRRRLADETTVLAGWLRDGRMDAAERRVGFELEAWLIDADGHPAPQNDGFLQLLEDPMVVPELSRFNFELNAEPGILGAGLLDRLHEALDERWRRCQIAAAAMQLRPLMIGILPTARSEDMVLDNMSPLRRYQAINEQVLRLRGGRPIELDIQGRDHLRHLHPDVMLEAATTSLQIHVEVSAKEAARAFNASKMASAASVGVGANSPFLFGHDLWAETRIPLFEQAVAVGASEYSKRVTFGVRYARESILECFEANRDYYPVILPDLIDAPVESLAHLRLHNGTIWRWNRPLIGFDDAGEPHCRIEHRVVAAGPSTVDAVANIALFLGLFEALLRLDDALEERLPLDQARANFYSAAQYGLDARVSWLDGDSGSLHDLLVGRLIGFARSGLESAGVPAEEARRWLAVIEGRVGQSMTGADWQRRWVGHHGEDFARLVDACADAQSAGNPVHEWSRDWVS